MKMERLSQLSKPFETGYLQLIKPLHLTQQMHFASTDVTFVHPYITTIYARQI